MPSYLVHSTVAPCLVVKQNTSRCWLVSRPPGIANLPAPGWHCDSSRFPISMGRLRPFHSYSCVGEGAKTCAPVLGVGRHLSPGPRPVSPPRYNRSGHFGLIRYGDLVKLSLFTFDESKPDSGLPSSVWSTLRKGTRTAGFLFATHHCSIDFP